MHKTKNQNLKTSAQEKAIRKLADNRLARHQYEILDTIEVGIELLGTEVKSIRAGKTNLRDGFCLIKKGEIQLHNVHISPHSHASNYFNHDPLRVRKLLAHRREIEKLSVQIERKGLSLIPISIYLKGSWIKIKLGVGKGKKLHDKRQDQKNKQIDREVKSALKRY